MSRACMQNWTPSQSYYTLYHPHNKAVSDSAKSSPSSVLMRLTTAGQQRVVAIARGLELHAERTQEGAAAACTSPLDPLDLHDKARCSLAGGNKPNPTDEC